MPKVPPISALLCESCGYTLDGLPSDAPCPECGRPIPLSLPGARPGSPWQQRRRPQALGRTWWDTLTRPRRSWEVVRIDAASSWSLLLATLALASLPLPAALAVRGASPVYVAVFLPSLFLVQLSLTAIEFSGIRFFAGRRGWRITERIALTICAHASAGWVVGGVAMGGLYLALSKGGPRMTSPAAAPALLAAFLSGMSLFSFLAGAGFHALRFANDPSERSDG